MSLPTPTKPCEKCGGGAWELWYRGPNCPAIRTAIRGETVVLSTWWRCEQCGEGQGASCEVEAT